MLSIRGRSGSKAEPRRRQTYLFGLTDRLRSARSRSLRSQASQNLRLSCSLASVTAYPTRDNT